MDEKRNLPCLVSTSPKLEGDPRSLWTRSGSRRRPGLPSATPETRCYPSALGGKGSGVTDPYLSSEYFFSTRFSNGKDPGSLRG